MVSPADFIGRRVGRFTITSHLASGGMAELFIARQEAAGGFEKDLVLKMLQEKYAQNPRVLGMFLDEARLAAKLNHQNIVHVYDVNEADGVRYIAMEYIHGETVTDIVRRAIAGGGFLPLEHAVQIVADAAAGLAYAHERRDAEGRAARIIHRDVSPSNILVTYEGVTKIVDFGIARVQDQVREESGMRPGKVSYMSPEQARSEPVDQRSDIFSLGILLYEITVGRRLFRGPPAEVLKKICESQVPPPTYVRRQYPPALELIVMKALEKRPAHRHQSAAELQHELQEFLEGAGLKSGSRRLAQYMKELFGVVEPRARGAAGSNGTLAVLGGPGGVASAPGARSTADDELEELDFDRRAPLVMRVVPRLEPVDDHPAQGSLDQPPPQAAATPAAWPLDPPVAEIETRASEPVAGARASDESGAIVTPEALTPEEAAAASGRLSIWVVLLVLLATGIVVFLGTRW
jgi:Protein kinase domain